MASKWTANFALDSVCGLGADMLVGMGIRLVMTDLDNTLTDYHESAPDERVRAWLEEVRSAGIALWVLSNNNEERVRRFCEPLGLPFVAKSGKPKPDSLLAVVRSLGLAKEQALMVGDQVFTDVWAAKRAEVTAVLVKPYRMGLWIRLRRIAEAPWVRAARRRTASK